MTPLGDTSTDLHECRRALRAMAAEVSRAQDDERHRIARGIHDDLGQLLATVQIRLQLLRHRCDDDQIAIVDDIDRLVSAAIGSSRSLAFEMMMPPLGDDIEPALARLAGRLEERWGVTCRFTADEGDKPVTAETAAALFRVVREVLSNVARHAEAGAASVAVERRGRQLWVTIEDDGKGFVPADPETPERGGVGLLIARERMKEIGGTVDVDTAPGRGTRVVVTAPLDGALTKGAMP
jgi:signal transduction histidine kinase